MASNTVLVRLLADAKGFQKGMKTAEDSTTAFERKASTFSKAVQGFFALQAVQAVGRFVDESVQAFSELEQSTGAVEAVFGDAVDSISADAKRAAEDFGLSASDFQESAALLGSQLKNQLGLDAEEAAAKTTDLIGVASDLAAQFGGSTSEAVSALASLLRGERDPIEKYAVSMNDAMVSAKALEMGLADSTGELTAQDKAAASLEILYDQTADAAGAFAREEDTLAGKTQRLNARMEDQKAQLGQALVPAYLAWNDVLGKILPQIGTLALGLGEVSGAITETDTALKEWEISAGKSVETANEWLRALADDVNIGKVREWLGQVPTMTDEFTNKILDGIDAWALGSAELANLSAELQFLKDTGQISQAQFETLTGAIEAKTAAIIQDEQWTSKAKAMEAQYKGAVGATTDATVAAKDATYDHLDAIRELVDEQRAATDPVFAFADATNDLAEAQADATTAAAEYGEGSPEHITALGKVRDAALDLKDAEIAVADEGAITAEQLKTHLRSLGAFTETEISAIIADFERINAFQFQAKTIRVTHEVTGGGPQRQHGGPVLPGQAYTVGERGPETFVPATMGRIVPGANGHGPAGGAVYNVTINAGMGADPNAISRAVVQALQRYQRANGAIPIRTLP